MNFTKVLLCFSFFILSSCSSTIPNLTEQIRIIQYHYESGAYNKELNEIVSDARNEFAGILPSKNSAVVFDIDETALSNYEAIKSMGFGYISDYWHKWILEAKAPAIEEVKDLYHFLISRGFKIIFITGRNHKEYNATYKNLINEGYTKFDTLIVRSPELKDAPAYNFKSIERLVLTQMGYRIAGCVGDQESDLEGENTGIKVKLPNYLYIID